MQLRQLNNPLNWAPEAPKPEKRVNMRKVLTLFALLLCSATMVQAADFGADKHVQKGVQCVICHGTDMNKPKEPTDKVCLQCHPREPLIEKTKHLNKSVNPHNPPHNGECILCHRMHEAPVNNCAECHKYQFQPK